MPKISCSDIVGLIRLYFIAFLVIGSFLCGVYYLIRKSRPDFSDGCSGWCMGIGWNQSEYEVYDRSCRCCNSFDGYFICQDFKMIGNHTVLVGGIGG